uniref:Cardiomyopathy-associated protein 5 n=1 Tax=Ditylenchus dipsaci TaxID=166011 RepID=A0A915ERV4_9BILA
MAQRLAELSTTEFKQKLHEESEEEGGKIKKMAGRFEEIADSQVYGVLSRDKEVKKLPLEILRPKSNSQVSGHEGGHAEKMPKIEVDQFELECPTYQELMQQENVSLQEEEAIPELPAESLMTEQSDSKLLESEQGIPLTELTKDLADQTGLKYPDEGASKRSTPVLHSSSDQSTAINEQMEMLQQDLPHQTLYMESTQHQAKEALQVYKSEIPSKDEQLKWVDKSEHSEMQTLETASAPDSPTTLHQTRLSNLDIEKDLPVQQTLDLQLRAMESHPENRIEELCQSEDLRQKSLVSNFSTSDGSAESKVRRMVEQQQEETSVADLKPLSLTKLGTEKTRKIKQMTEKLEKQPVGEEMAASQVYEVLVRDKELRNLALDVSKQDSIGQSGVFEGQQPDEMMVRQIEAPTNSTSEELIKKTNSPVPTLQETTEQQVSHEVLHDSFLEQLAEEFDLEETVGTQEDVTSASNDSEIQELEVEKSVAAPRMPRRAVEVLSQSEDSPNQILLEVPQEHQTTQQLIDPMADKIKNVAKKMEEQTIKEVQPSKALATRELDSKISEMALKFKEIASSLEYDRLSRDRELKMLPLEISNPELLGLEEEHQEEILRSKKETSQLSLSSRDSEVPAFQKSTKQQEVLEPGLEVIQPDMFSESFREPFGLEQRTEAQDLEEKHTGITKKVEKLSKSEDLPYRNIADKRKMAGEISKVPEKLKEQRFEEVKSTLPSSFSERGSSVGKMTGNFEEISANKLPYDVLASGKELKKLNMKVPEVQTDETAREADEKTQVEEIRSDKIVEKAAGQEHRLNQEKDFELAGQQTRKLITESELGSQNKDTERPKSTQKYMQTQPQTHSYSSEELTQQPILNITQDQDPIKHKHPAQATPEAELTEITPAERQEEEQGIKLVTSFELDLAPKVTGIWKVAERYEEVDPEEQSLTVTAFGKDLFKVSTSQDSQSKTESRNVRPPFGKSLSCINESEEGDERQMQMSPNQLRNPPVLILLWLEPELEMDYVVLDKSGWTNKVNKEKLAVNEGNDQPGDSSSSSSDESSSSMSQSTFIEYAVGTPESLEGSNREDLLSFDEEFVGEHTEQMEQIALRSSSDEAFIEHPSSIDSQELAPEMLSTAIQTCHQRPEQILADLPLLNVNAQPDTAFSSQPSQGTEQPQNPGTSQDLPASTQANNSPFNHAGNQPPAQIDPQVQNPSSSSDIVAGEFKYEETSIQTLSPRSILYHDAEKPATDLELLSQNVTITLSSQLPSTQLWWMYNLDLKEVKKEASPQQFVRVVKETTEIEEYVTVERIPSGHDGQNADPAKPSGSGYTTSQIQTTERPVEQANSRTRHQAERQLPKTPSYQQTTQSTQSDPNAQWHRNTAVQTSPSRTAQTFSNHPYPESTVQAQNPAVLEHQPFERSPNLGYMTDLDKLHMLFHQHEPIEYHECPEIASKPQLAHTSMQTSPSLFTTKFSPEPIDTNPKNISDNELERVRHTLEAIRTIIHSPMESEGKKLVETYQSSVLQAVSGSQERSSQSLDLEFSSEPDSLGSQSGPRAMEMTKRRMDVEEREMEKTAEYLWSPLVVKEKVKSGVDLESRSLQIGLDQESSSQTDLSRAQSRELQRQDTEPEQQWNSRKAIKYKSDDKLRALKRFSDPGFSPEPALLGSQSGVAPLESQQEELENLPKSSERHYSTFSVNKQPSSQDLEAPEHQPDYRQVIEEELRVLRQGPKEVNQIPKSKKERLMKSY